MHVLGTRVPRRLGVARSASSPKAAQALGCSLTPGLRILPLPRMTPYIFLQTEIYNMGVSISKHIPCI